MFGGGGMACLYGECGGKVDVVNKTSAALSTAQLPSTTTAGLCSSEHASKNRPRIIILSILDKGAS